MVTQTKEPGTAEARSFEQFIGGQWTAGATGQTYERKNPATGTLVETIPWGDAEDARKATDAARVSRTSWKDYR